jgi:hypothetical protein
MGKPLKPKAQLAIRKNVSFAPEIIRLTKVLCKERGDRGLSVLLTNLIKDERRRRHPKPGIQSRTAPRRPFDERVTESAETLMEDFKEYTVKCMRDNPEAGGKSAMFESWALQRLASLVVRGVELEERITDLEGSSRR